jgi:carboxyl-terminal processing protease
MRRQRPSDRRPAAVRRALFVTAGCALLAGGAAATREDPAALLRNVMVLVHDRFEGDTAPSVYERAARGLVKELGDPYSQLLSPRELDDFARTSLGRYAGVGMTVVPVGESTFVGEVYVGGPSAGAGLRRGDRLVSVDGRSVAGLSLDSIVGRLRGLPRTPVTIGVERAGAPQQFSLNRAVVRVPAVPYVLVDRGVAYVPLPNVSETAGAAVEAALVAAERDGARGVVLDVRGNPGGAVDQAVRVVSALLQPGKPVLEIRERRGSTLLRTEGAPTALAIPVVVLQDGGSASAAEIIAGALQDHDRALLVGTRSYGKGLAQTLYPLQGGYSLKLTTAKWFTPVGRSIHRDRTAGDSARHEAERARGADLDSATFFSVGGRVLAGGGGITPDVVVPYDTLGGADREMALRLRRDAGVVSDAMTRVAHRLSVGADTGFRVTPAWRDALHRELAARGVQVDSAQWVAGGRYVDRLLEQRVADFVAGQSLAGGARSRTTGSTRRRTRCCAPPASRTDCCGGRAVGRRGTGPFEQLRRRAW